ncbi:NADH:(hydroxy)cinnamate reductase subunit CrdA isoform X2 [Cherax quadricarinatus]|uniref:NADH:(hydroxy)cinnamate reductase subunit CrdA isoform X2 n=1 Tax=Cherax quadricarinatus TaxID=27406 RepID=UPI0023793BA7|nr:FMN-dependent NADPH-azoreductase-like isoform X2 [Cherax quadricarinatus]
MLPQFLLFTSSDPLKLGSNGHIEQPLHFRKDPSQAPEWMISTNAKIQQANAFIIVTPEYNCALPPALTSIMDQFPPASYRHKPCAIVAYSLGTFGGIRAAAFARPFLSELGMISTPYACVIPQVQGKFNDDGECTDDRIKKNVEKLMDEIQWYGLAISDKIKADGVPS